MLYFIKDVYIYLLFLEIYFKIHARKMIKIWMQNSNWLIRISFLIFRNTIIFRLRKHPGYSNPHPFIFRPISKPVPNKNILQPSKPVPQSGYGLGKIAGPGPLQASNLNSICEFLHDYSGKVLLYHDRI